MRKLPDLLIIGAMKCGTTSLHHYLDLHPEIAMAPRKELNFFARQGNWDKGLDWYESQLGNGSRLLGESSPHYTFYPFARGVPERAAELIPNAKLIYMVRDPIDRIVSHWVHRVSTGREARSLSEVVATLDRELAGHVEEPSRLSNEAGYLARSLYHLQLSQWLRSYPASSVMVIDQEALRTDRYDVLRSVFRFLGVDEDFASKAFEATLNPSEGRRLESSFGARVRASRIGRLTRRAPGFVRRPAARAFVRAFDQRVERPGLSSDERDVLRRLLGPDVELLREFTEQRFADWSL